MSEVKRYRFKGAAGEYVYAKDYDAALAREALLERKNENQYESIRRYQDREAQLLADKIDDDNTFNAANEKLRRSESALRDELQELRDSMSFRTSLIGKTIAERDGFRAQLAERDALLREAWDLPAVHEHMPKAWHDRMIALSTSAEPKPRGEAVAWRVTSSGATTVALQYPKWAVGDCGLTVTPLYAEPAHSGDINEMVAKVVLPERMTLRSSDGTETYETKSWNACLDATAKLNGINP